MVSGIINEGNLPVPSFFFHKRPVFVTKLSFHCNFLKYKKKEKKNVFKKIARLKFKNSRKKFYENNYLSLNHIKTSSDLLGNGCENNSKDSSEDTSIDDLESNLGELTGNKLYPSFLLAVIEKVYRRNTKWTILLKEGILNINKKDFLFNSCKCEFLW